MTFAVVVFAQAALAAFGSLAGYDTVDVVVQEAS